MPPRFLYFDLGNVLLHFDHRLACRQMGEVAGLSEQQMWDIVFAGDLELRYESGAIDDQGFYDAVAAHCASPPDQAALLLAGSAIFTPNWSIMPLVGGLVAARQRLGILSNTCPGHWSYCSDGRYGMLNAGFEVFALSYELGACKPDPVIFERAAKLAGVSPEEVFFVDDIETNVAAARAAGFDAVQYTTTVQLAADLRARGVEFNY